MNNSDITDPEFLKAVEAIDAGDISSLKVLLSANPHLISKRLDTPTEGYFKHPYLMWFVADNPIRHEKLPGNIVEVTKVLIDTARSNDPENFQQQIDYTLALVATGRIPKVSGVQIELIDLLIDNGAKPGNGIGALAHGNIIAANHLIERGGKLTLATAVGLENEDEIYRLSKDATQSDLELALMMASFYGKSKWISYLVTSGVNVNARIDRDSGFHSHASALHQAVFSGSLESVRLLVEAGADLNAEDTIYEGTALDWALYMEKEEKVKMEKKKYKEISDYFLLISDE